MSGKRKSVHVEGVSHGAPIPMGSVVGNLLFSSGITGTDPATGEVPPDLDSQCELAFANMKTLVENAGGSVDNIGSIKVYMQDRSQRDTVNRPWLKMFPDEEDRPARHAIEYQGFTPGILVQLEIVAVLD
jgi:2-iminobutanoate/2-iminopropanoate deaminase